MPVPLISNTTPQIQLYFSYQLYGQLYHSLKYNSGSNKARFAGKITAIITFASLSHSYDYKTRCARVVITIIQLCAVACTYRPTM